MQALPLILMTATTALSVGSQIGGGIAASRQAKASARYLEARGRAEAEDRRREAARLLGRQRALYAKAGVMPETGTPLDVLAATAAEEELQALRIKFGWKQEARQERAIGRAALTRGITGALGTILGTAGSAGFQRAWGKAFPKQPPSPGTGAGTS